MNDPGESLVDSRLRRPAARAPGQLERGPVTVDELIGLELEAGTRDVGARLLARGASPDFARLVLSEVLRGGARGAYAIDAAAETLARAVPVLPSPKRPRRGE